MSRAASDVKLRLVLDMPLIFLECSNVLLQSPEGLVLARVKDAELQRVRFVGLAVLAEAVEGFEVLFLSVEFNDMEAMAEYLFDGCIVFEEDARNDDADLVAVVSRRCV